MSVHRWKVENDTLGYLDGDEFIVPDAMDICNLIFQNQGNLADKPINDPKIEKLFKRESRIFCDRGLVLDVKEAQGNFEILCLPSIRKKDGSILVLPRGYEHDHIISGNVWMPIREKSLPLPAGISFLEEGNDNHQITLRNYLDLITNQDHFSFVDNRISYHLNAENLGNRGVYMRPEGFNADMHLRPYQQKGFSWLNMLAEQGLGCILADEMALGKTVQMIALICHRKYLKKGKTLVVCPVTLIENWRREVLKFSEGISVAIHYGANRSRNFKTYNNDDVVITNYESVINDLPALRMISWDMVILDEAHAIKNPDTERSKAVKKLHRNLGIALTGTPMENRIDDIWSIMDFANPGFLDDISAFRELYENTEEDAARLEPIIAPLKLRRIQKDVLADLPNRTDMDESLVMSAIEAEDYNNLRGSIKDQGNFNIEPLRQSACYSKYQELQSEDSWERDPTERSIKFRRLKEIMEKIIDSREKVLVFGKYTLILEFIRFYSESFLGVQGFIMTGDTPVLERQLLIDEFSDVEGPAVLVMNLLVGGTGLNITAANNVIHFMPDWTSTKTEQATMRVLRPGQEKPVKVYYFYYLGTVEEALIDLQHRKSRIIDQVVKADPDAVKKPLLQSLIEMNPAR